MPSVEFYSQTPGSGLGYESLFAFQQKPPLSNVVQQFPGVAVEGGGCGPETKVPHPTPAFLVESTGGSGFLQLLLTCRVPAEESFPRDLDPETWTSPPSPFL